MKTILYLVIWANGHEEKFYVKDFQELLHYLSDYSQKFGLPDLIYRKE